MQAIKCSWAKIYEAKPKKLLQNYQGRISLSEKKVREKLLIFWKNIYPCNEVVYLREHQKAFGALALHFVLGHLSINQTVRKVVTYW